MYLKERMIDKKIEWQGIQKPLVGMKIRNEKMDIVIVIGIGNGDVICVNLYVVVSMGVLCAVAWKGKIVKKE